MGFQAAIFTVSPVCQAASSRLSVLFRTKAHNELVAHIQEMREMQRKRDNDVKLQEFFATKGQKRFMKDLEDIYLKKRQKNKALIEVNLEHYLNMLIAIREFANIEHIPVGLILLQNTR